MFFFHVFQLPQSQDSASATLATTSFDPNIEDEAEALGVEEESPSGPSGPSGPSAASGGGARSSGSTTPTVTMKRKKEAPTTSALLVRYLQSNEEKSKKVAAQVNTFTFVCPKLHNLLKFFFPKWPLLYSIHHNTHVVNKFHAMFFSIQ